MNFFTRFLPAFFKRAKARAITSDLLKPSSSTGPTFNSLIMRLNLVFLLVLFTAMQVVATTVSGQTITMKAKNLPLDKALNEIKKQSSYGLFYDSKDLPKDAKVTIDLQGATVEEALKQCIKDRPLQFQIVDKLIIIKAKEQGDLQRTGSPKRSVISGKVINERGDPIPGANVTVKGTGRKTVTDNSGNYSIDAGPTDVLVFSFVGYALQERKIGGNEQINVVLVESSGQLDQVQVIAYGTTTRRLNTGSVGTISAKDIANQPVSNPLATLVGRVPGLVVTQQSGVPGSSFSIQIRGRNSISQGSQPLILIDGIPFAAGNENMQLINSAINNFNQGSGVSPFNAINPGDIESIEVLKDADATAIYGSRGANGVVLITTKTGKAGKTQISANFNQGITQVGKLLPLLNTEQYLVMRKEAFVNAGITQTTINAPDLTVFDQNRHTDYQKEFLGGTGHTTNANLSLSGGSDATQFLLSGTYYRESSIYPGDLPNQRGSMLANISHKSTDNRFQVNFSGNFTSVENKAPTIDLTSSTFLSPNTPDFFDANGKLQWAYNGIIIQNPYAYLKETYQIRTNNLASSLNASYKIWRGLSAKVLAGYNQQFTNEQRLSPAEAKSPISLNPGHSATIGKNQFNSWNIEPQLEYTTQIWKGKFTALAGVTFLSRSTSSLTIDGTGYSSEALLGDFDAASAIDASSLSSLYRYQAVFSRINYNIQDKYLVNFTGRRDGSSRFGPGKQFANFGAIGVAWIFTSENWLRNNPILSFGKLRTSYGVTGNDQIGDYQFVETWKAATNSYVGSSALIPNNLYNGNYAWEKNNKLEAAIDLGFFQDQILLSAGYFQNRSSNQLINYKVPYITGFTSVIANFPAVVENKGCEFSLSGTPVRVGRFRWESSFNITFPRNTLVSFPGIETSSYNYSYIVGESLNSIYNYTALDVNSQTGYLNFVDRNANNSADFDDYGYNGKTDPKYYGGWQNTIVFAGLELQVFLDYKKQLGRNLYYYLYGPTLSAGIMMNQPESTVGRWKNIGDRAELPKVMPSSTGTVGNNLLNSSFAYSDQSFIRLRNVSISYSLGNKVLTKAGAKAARVYLQGQNLLTFNKTKGYDPETQNPIILPAMQVYTVGLQITY